jgi:2-polyprenyl-3-methyl-5-hydroxy-6-metoxy-1,4-benzoquinol methylase
VQAQNIATSGSSYTFNSAEASHTNAYLSPLLITLCKEFCVSTVLDIGCGNGALANDLTRAGFSVVGCDPSGSGIEHANRAVPKGIFYQVGIYEDPAIIQETDFDVVVSTEVVEHVFSPRHLPRFAAAKLKSRGYLIISTPYHGYIKNLVLSLFGKWDVHHTVLWDGGHIKFWSRKTLTQMLEGEGFRVERFIGCGRVPYLWKSMVIVARKIS